MTESPKFPFRSYLNILKFRLAMALRTSRIFNYPILAVIEPTSACNLHCPACPTGMKLDSREKTTLSYPRFCEIIDELSPYLMYLYFFNWGEPLLHKDSIKMINYASQKGINVRISSNLSFKMSDEFAQELVKSGLHYLVVGLDGVDQESYAKYRRGGDFELVVSNVKKIAKYKKQLNKETPLLHLPYHVFKHNEDTVAEAQKLAETIGFDLFTVDYSYIPPKDAGTKIEGPSNKSLSIYDKIMESFTFERTCSWLYGAIVHNPNGSVSPCCGIVYEDHDFDNWSKDKHICSIMNNTKYVLARNITRKTNKDATFKLDDGMGFTHIEIDPSTEVICKKCPTPYIWGKIKNIVTPNIVARLQEDYKRANLRGKAYIALCYLLMGAPQLFHILHELFMKNIGKNKEIING